MTLGTRRDPSNPAALMPQPDPRSNQLSRADEYTNTIFKLFFIHHFHLCASRSPPEID